ncbi:hypothetical protein NCCP2495_05850 [Dietzia sp. NCCP-2495]|uniref:hypothetical protein n=1 Tax=Dietzia sp. NCCP-2495 TaxID=2934675 RepID=UPI0022305E14|nr:hypothetical protein [Dietzia sp. NCCP-2495]GLB62707.1 hypothetical protein NCCP2495_05850 [Dietzia sp. NCCP-2495]
MMPYSELREQMMRSLQRARALAGIEVVADLYEAEVDEASRALKWLILHPDHETGHIPAEVMEEINSRFDAAFPKAVAS